MDWNKARWNEYLRQGRSALVKRDILSRGATLGADWEVALRREREAWAARAKAYLRGLAILAREASDAPRRQKTLYELRRWYDKPWH